MTELCNEEIDVAIVRVPMLFCPHGRKVIKLPSPQQLSQFHKKLGPITTLHVASERYKDVELPEFDYYDDEDEGDDNGHNQEEMFGDPPEWAATVSKYLMLYLSDAAPALLNVTSCSLNVGPQQKLTAAAVKRLAATLPQLQHLHLLGGQLQMPSNALSGLVAGPRLASLRIDAEFKEFMAIALFKHLSGVRQLRKLHLPNAPMTGQVLSAMAVQLRNLTEVGLTSGRSEHELGLCIGGHPYHSNALYPDRKDQRLYGSMPAVRTLKVYGIDLKIEHVARLIAFMPALWELDGTIELPYELTAQQGALLRCVTDRLRGAQLARLWQGVLQLQPHGPYTGIGSVELELTFPAISGSTPSVLAAARLEMQAAAAALPSLERLVVKVSVSSAPAAGASAAAGLGVCAGAAVAFGSGSEYSNQISNEGVDYGEDEGEGGEDEGQGDEGDGEGDEDLGEADEDDAGLQGHMPDLLVLAALARALPTLREIELHWDYRKCLHQAGQRLPTWPGVIRGGRAAERWQRQQQQIRDCGLRLAAELGSGSGVRVLVFRWKRLPPDVLKSCNRALAAAGLALEVSGSTCKERAQAEERRRFNPPGNFGDAPKRELKDPWEYDTIIDDLKYDMMG